MYYKGNEEPQRHIWAEASINRTPSDVVKSTTLPWLILYPKSRDTQKKTVIHQFTATSQMCFVKTPYPASA